MAKPTAEEIALDIKEQLSFTSFACSTLIPLSGGNANYIFMGRLSKPLDDRTTMITIKHGESHSASFTGLQLSTDRCTLESDCLKEAENGLAPVTNEACSVRTPRVFHYDLQRNTQIQEYLPNSLDLKRYALEHFSASTPLSENPAVVEIGRGLGRWLRSFHDWAATQTHLRDLARTNREMQALKLRYNYELLLSRVDTYPDILSGAKTVFEEVLGMAKAELCDEDQLQVIHGDFWTGNILLPVKKLSTGPQTPLFVIDWEMCQLWRPELDLGQMIAELYQLTLYKDIQAGLWLIEGFVSGYGLVNDSFAFRTLLHVGTHLVGFGSGVAGWGEPEQCENVARVGRDIILRAWQKDRSWFEGHDLACVFATAS
ncbi:unnamed protein product [Discula destructiva]